MPQTITVSAKSLVDEAMSRVETLPLDEAMALIDNADVVFVDIRDPRELGKLGKIPGAFHCPRGMLEFWIDPESPYFKPIFGENKRFIFYCGSNWRSALATDVAQRMGLSPVCHIGEGFSGWVKAGGPVEAVPQR